MYESFHDSLMHIRSEISRGRYPTFSKIYKELDSLKEQIHFCYKFGLLSLSEFNNLRFEIFRCVQFFNTFNEIQKSDT